MNPIRSAPGRKCRTRSRGLETAPLCLYSEGLPRSVPRASAQAEVERDLCAIELEVRSQLREPHGRTLAYGTQVQAASMIRRSERDLDRAIAMHGHVQLGVPVVGRRAVATRK